MATEKSQWTHVSFALILPFDARAVDEDKLRMLKVSRTLTERRNSRFRKTPYNNLHDALWKPVDACRPKGSNGAAIQNHRQRRELRRYTHSVKLQEALESSARYIWYPGYQHPSELDNQDPTLSEVVTFPTEGPSNRFAVFSTWSGGRPGGPSTPDPDLGEITLNAAEVLTYQGEPLAYLVLHLHQKTDRNPSMSDDELADLMVRMRRPGLKRANRPVFYLDPFLKEINLTKLGSAEETASYTWGGFLNIGKAPYSAPSSKQSLILRDRTRAFLLTHAIPEGDGIQSPALLAGHTDWPLEQRWAFLATNGVHPEATLRLPPRSAEAAECGGFERNTYHARISRDGFALIGDASIDGSSSPALANQIKMDRWANQCLMHTRLVDLAILAQRQKMQLDLHADNLKLLWGDETDGEDPKHTTSTNSLSSEITHRAKSLDRQLSYLQEQQEKLAYFRNKYWIRDVSGHPDDSEFLQRLQDALGSPQALQEVISEQTSLYEYVSTEQRAAEAQVRQEDQEVTREREHQLELLLAIFVPASVIPSLGALFIDPSLPQGILWTFFTAIFTALCIFGWMAWSRRQSRNAKDSSDNASGTSERNTNHVHDSH